MRATAPHRGNVRAGIHARARHSAVPPVQRGSAPRASTTRRAACILLLLSFVHVTARGDGRGSARDKIGRGGIRSGGGEWRTVGVLHAARCTLPAMRCCLLFAAALAAAAAAVSAFMVLDRDSCSGRDDCPRNYYCSHTRLTMCEPAGGDMMCKYGYNCVPVMLGECDACEEHDQCSTGKCYRRRCVFDTNASKLECGVGKDVGEACNEHDACKSYSCVRDVCV